MWKAKGLTKATMKLRDSSDKQKKNVSGRAEWLK
jgi:hypothetical protein